LNPISKIYYNLIKQISQGNELITYISELKKKDLQIGFVPTMGALHEGHLSLISQCKQGNDICVSSIFINPTQFNDIRDFEKYPRLIQKDIKKLDSIGCDIVFTPNEEDIYPGKVYSKINIDLGYLGQVMEAAHRPGHFDGVVTIVKKLFDLVKPDTVYFGQKDYQQYKVIKRMIEFFMYDIKLILVETIRESDGLAMSSRNLILNRDERKLAPIIFSTLSMAKKLLKEKSIAEVKDWAANIFRREKLIIFEYFEIVDADSLKPINSLQQADRIIICTAMKIGNVRLIDNMFVKK
jgi:pantoate--beta-alanine ligase